MVHEFKGRKKHSKNKVLTSCPNVLNFLEVRVFLILDRLGCGFGSSAIKDKIIESLITFRPTSEMCIRHKEIVGQYFTEH